MSRVTLSSAPRSARGAYATGSPARHGAERGLRRCTLLLGLARISDVNLLAYLAAFGGGVVSFLSPCVLPLVPGYLSMVTGLDLADLEEASARTRAASSRRRRCSSPGSARCSSRSGSRRRASGSCCATTRRPSPPVGRAHVRDGAVPARLAVPARAVAVPGEAIPPAPRGLRRRGTGRRGRGLRLRLVAVHRPDPRIDPRHRRDATARVGGRDLADGLFARPRPAVPCLRPRARPASAARSAG